MLSQKEYVKKGGEHCPKCGSSDIIVDGTPDADGLHASVQCNCPKCHSSWFENYVLAGYICFIDGETGEEIPNPK